MFYITLNFNMVIYRNTKKNPMVLFTFVTFDIIISHIILVTTIH